MLAQAKALNETDYTVKTWKYVQDAIDTAEEVIANRDTKTKVRRAKSSLNTWMGQLVRKYDTTVLEQKIAQAEACLLYTSVHRKRIQKGTEPSDI